MDEEDSMSVTSLSIEELAINTIRTLSMDGVQAANSGHPGPRWRWLLSPINCGHRIFSSIHANRLAQSRSIRAELRSCVDAHLFLAASCWRARDRSKWPFRPKQIGCFARQYQEVSSIRKSCAGHPEYGEAAGIETTTGPLGQGVGNSVGMAMASRYLGARYNRPGFELFDFRVYALCGDGDLMEGVASEAASLAGHLRLANLCWIYDDNGITIEGHTDLAFSEDVAQKFRGMGWNTIRVEDANDAQALQAAFSQFQSSTDKPTLILVRSVIGYGSPNKANTHGAHGAPLGDEEIKLTKQFYGWPADAKFEVPPEVPKHFQDTLGARGAAASSQWQRNYDEYQTKFPTEAAELKAILTGISQRVGIKI